MKNIFRFSVTFLIVMAFSAKIATCEPLPEFNIITERWLPYQFEEGGKVQGVSVDLLVLLLKHVGSSQGRESIKIYPWARAYREAQNNRNTILFLTTRTPERENLFKWVGPAIKNRWLLIAKKNRRLKIESATDLNDYTFGTVIDDVGENHLLNLAVKREQLERNTAYINCIKMIQADRVDMVVMSWETFSLYAMQGGIDRENFEKVFTIGERDLYYAFHKDTSDWIIDKFQKAFDGLNAEGKIDALIWKYKTTKEN
ncbi:MAG: ABC transporter substrate-binding protein [Desulfobacterales bacterium]|nr:ABC transporter substrate-binding protein [Desulfobacterales bacterium]